MSLLGSLQEPMLLPPPPPSQQAVVLSASCSGNAQTGSSTCGSTWGWSKMEPNVNPDGGGGQAAPCQRSLHVAVVLDNKMYIFGG
jgi:hypothetical protein